jgi:class 3 adenylate cyclase
MVGGAPDHGLIGRGFELEVTSRLLREAARGTPRLLVLTGPAGVGKSTLGRALADEAGLLGARVLWGSGQEDLSIPYLPMAMALEGLRDDEQGTRIAFDDDPTRSWPVAGDLLLAASDRELLMLVVDDLQWTDAASQSLLLHLVALLDQAARTRAVRCLVVVTARTPIVDQRANRTLDRLRREPGLHELDLPGLDRVGVAELMATFCPARPSALLVERVAEATAGNPLLVQSLVRRGLSERRLVEHDGALGLRDAGDHLTLDPAELDQGVVARLETLGDAARRLLTFAALLGDDQPVDELLDVAGAAGTEADALLDEAAHAGLLVERGARCGFAHPQVRHVLVNQPTQRARQRLHLEIADALERRHGDAGAVPVSHHLGRAGAHVDAARVARWSRLAAEQAKAQGAWADACIAGEQALAALGPDAPWADRVDLHTLVTNMASFDFDLPAVVRHGTSAIAIAREAGDGERWGRALLPLARTLVTHAGERDGIVDPSPLLQDFLDANPQGPAELRARILGLLSEICTTADRPEEALRAAVAARELLQEGTDPQVAGLVLVAEGLVRLTQLQLPEAAAAYQQAVDAVGVDPGERAGMYAAVRVNLVRTLAGDARRAADAGSELLELLDGAQVWGEHAMVAAIGCAAALVEGRFADVERLGQLADRSARRSGHLDPFAITQPALALGRALRGDGRGAHEAIGLVLRSTGAQVRYGLAIDALLGDVDRVRAAVLARPWRDPRREASLHSLQGAVLHAEVATALGDASMVDAAVVPLRGAHQLGVVVSYGWAVLLSRLIGDALGATGRHEEADGWLAIARDEARAHGMPVEAARIALSGARLAALRRDSDALDRAAEAAVALDEVGALPLVAAARRLGREGGGEAPGPARRVILFTDLVDSTTLNVRAGDRAFLDLVREHNDLVRSCLRRTAGVEFKHTGDGIAAWFTDPAGAVECTMAINEELDRATLLHPDLPLLVRCGISSGEPLGNEGDLFGLSVVLAARLCAAAAAGEVLVGPEVVAPARAHGLVFRHRGPMALKGFPEPIDVHEAVMTAVRTPTA